MNPFPSDEGIRCGGGVFYKDNFSPYEWITLMDETFVYGTQLLEFTAIIDKKQMLFLDERRWAVR